MEINLKKIEEAKECLKKELEKFKNIQGIGISFDTNNGPCLVVNIKNRGKQTVKSIPAEFKGFVIKIETIPESHFQ